MLALAPVALNAYAPAVVSRVSTIKAVAEGVAPDFSDKPWTSGEIKDAAGLKELSIKLNPVVGYWDPLKLADRNFWNQGEEVSTGPCLWPPRWGSC